MTAAAAAAIACCAASLAQQPDAVIELWEQIYTLRDDGSTLYHEKKHVRLNDPRAYGDFADWRITYNADTDTLSLITARTRRPDGTYRELPEYANVEAAPGSTAGWPALAGIRQRVLVMAGIEPGAVLEVEYEIDRRPGATFEFAFDMPLKAQYPIHERRIRIDHGSAPAALVLSNVEGLRLDDAPESDWTIAVRDLPARPSEPQMPPWWADEPRASFSSVNDADPWRARRVGQIDAAAQSSPELAAAAVKWTEGASDDVDKVRRIQEKLAATFNFVDPEPAWHPAALRPASAVFQDNYGLADEACALFLALARAAGAEATPAVLIQTDRWRAGTPQESMVAAYAVKLARAPSDARLWEARRGRIARSARFADVAELGDDGVRLDPWLRADDSRCHVSIDVKLDPNAMLTGTAMLRLSGLFLAADELRKADAQKARISAILGRVLPGPTIESFTVRALADSQFDVEAKLKSDQPLSRVAGRYQLQLAEDPPFLADVPMPLARSDRTQPLRLAGAFEERVEFKVAWPKEWTVDARPVSANSASGGWGFIEQRVSGDGAELRISRTVRLAERDVQPGAWPTIREALNAVRTEAARTLMLTPPAP